MELDMTPGSSFANRTTSAFPVSIGTSICLEALYKGRTPSVLDTEKQPDKVRPEKYQSIYINVDTLYRNLMASVSSQVQNNALDVVILDYLLEDIDIINSVFSVEGNNLIKPYYYSMTYETIKLRAPKHVEFRQPNTDRQKLAEAKRLSVISHLLKQSEEIVQFDSAIEFFDPNEHSLIITHSVYDLFNYRAVPKLDLLETHTGKLKSYQEWGTKYHPVGKLDIDRLPFNRRLFWVLGDRVLVKPMPIPVRRALVDVANESKWTPLTTDEKVKFDIANKSDNDILKQTVNALPDKIR